MKLSGILVFNTNNLKIAFRQQKLSLKSEIKQELLDKIVETVTQRDDKLAFEGVELLEKFLRLHLDTCEECCTKDCDYLKFVQDKFVGSSSIRIKIKSTLMVLLDLFKCKIMSFLGDHC